MSGTEDRQPGDELDEGRDVETGGTGSGGTLFGRSFRRQRGTSPELSPTDRRRRLAYAGGGALVTAAVAVLGFRWLRGRRG